MAPHSKETLTVNETQKVVLLFQKQIRQFNTLINLTGQLLKSMGNSQPGNLQQWIYSCNPVDGLVFI